MKCGIQNTYISDRVKISSSNLDVLIHPGQFNIIVKGKDNSWYPLMSADHFLVSQVTKRGTSGGKLSLLQKKPLLPPLESASQPARAIQKKKNKLLVTVIYARFCKRRLLD